MLEGALVPELSVMRVFAGENLQSEATFKTVLLNSSTTSSELVRQAMQRFRLPHAEDPNDYYLTIKQYEGDEAKLRKEERPLEIFEELVESALNIPTVKRSSISSISSNLSMQPAITRLAMNDFTDDSTVKLYLNRKSTFPEGITDIPDEDGMTPTQSTEGPSIRADDSMASIASRDPVDAALSRLNGKPQLSGVDLVLPDKGVIRSARSGVDERMLYSYVQPDGETYDISDIIEEELWDVGQDRRSGGSRAGRPSMDDEDEVSPISAVRSGSRTGSTRGDLLEDVLVKPRDVVEQRIDQVLAKIKDGRRASSLASFATDTSRQHSKPSEDRRSPTPRSGSATGRRQGEASGSRSETPVYQGRSSPQQMSRGAGTHSQQASIASVMSDYTPDNSTGMKSSTTERTTPGTTTRPPIILKDDFGLSNMMAVIEANANAKKPPPTPPMSEVEELLFGSNLQLEDLHPAARDLFAPMFERMENVNKQLDLLLQQTFRA
ncbi:hypothetical protein FRC01_013717 [Tulasnella sp. 417]|nr:hypothetical protein FRC01_013717 [Tulasnella sp. 417]